MEQALANRVEIAQARINIESNKLNLVGIKNSLKPTLQAFAELTNNGLTGDLTPFGASQGGVPGYLVGGYGNLLGQIARRDYPNYSAGFSLNIPFRNRAAQSDYATSLLEIRQNELSLQKSVNQVRVDVQNAVIGFQQARARYEAAVKAQVLQQQTLEADQKKYGLGARTAYQVVQDQRDLASAESAEVQAMANYSHARIAFDQALGTTLDVNHVSLNEALAGQVQAAPSSLPTEAKPMTAPRTRKALAVGLSWLCSFSLLPAQQASIEPVRPSAPIVWRPYLSTEVPPSRLANSPRLRELVRAGKLYLTAQDAIALALENNIDVEVARYNPLIAAWQLERAQAGGALPGVPSGASQAGAVASGQGVAGSQAAAGVNGGPSSASTGASGNASIAQIGPVTQTLDPIFQETSTFSHRSTPQPNTTQSGILDLIGTTRVYSGSLQEGFISGGSATLTYSNHYLNENAPSDVLNPSDAPSVSISMQHNFLNGFGVAVNARNITVARIGTKNADLNFRTQVIGVVVSVLNAYYALAADFESVKASQSALDVARKFYEDNRKQVEVGTLAPLDLTTAESQAASSQRDLVVAETSLQQDQLTLKNLISRNGIADPVLADAQIVPVDQIAMPPTDDLQPVSALVKQALANRSDLAVERANITSAETSALGTRNGILPVLVGFATLSAAGLAGTPRTVNEGGFVQTANPYFAGGMGNALGQVFRRDFPTQVAGAFFRASIGNRQAQADFGIDQLQLRQTQLTTEKDAKQVQVDVMNSVVALRQARVRYDAAVHNRILEQQLLDAEQKKFGLGASTPYAVVQQQRDLATAQSTEIAALVSYSNARVALDRTLGTTLDVNHVNIGEVRDGRITQASATAPAANPAP